MNKVLRLIAVSIFLEVAAGASVSDQLAKKEGNTQFTWNIYLPTDEAPKESEVPKKSESIRDCPRDRSGIYWKSWEGSIPKDAVVGASTTNDQGDTVEVFMAQAYLPFKQAALQPVQIFKDSKSVFASYNIVHEITGPIKVLCSQEPESLEWYDFSSEYLEEPGMDLVIAGNENGYNLYFGRTQHHGRTLIGKAVVKDRTLYFPDGTHEGNTGRFEILGYKKKSSVDENIDQYILVK